MKPKKIRRKVRKYRTDIEQQLIADMCAAPLKYRLKWSWKIFWALNKNKRLKTRRQRKRVPINTQQGLTTKEIKKLK
jgi:hypothetical protein